MSTTRKIIARTTLALVSAAAAALLATGCGANATPTHVVERGTGSAIVTTAEPSATIADQPIVTAAAPIGSTIPFTWDRYTGDSGSGTLFSATVTEPGDSTRYAALKNDVLLVLDVSVQATAGTVNVSPAYWQLRDTDGHVYPQTYPGSANTPEPRLTSGDITPADGVMRGLIGFDVPAGMTQVQLKSVVGSVVATWTLS